MIIDLAPAVGEGWRGFSGPARDAFAAAYPNQTSTFRHELADHPLLSLEALAQAAERMAPERVLCKAAGEPLEAVRSCAVAKPENPGDMVRAIAENHRWIGFDRIESLPEYDALLRSVVGEMEDLIRPATGPAQRLQAYIFVSSPGARFPFHFDPEFNILCQISGRKRFATFPARPPWLHPENHETYHAHGNNRLVWDAALASGGTVHTLDPGDALYVPFKLPHWVEVDGEPSISLSLTWCSKASLKQNDAWMCNHWLRQRGFAPRTPADLPGRSRLRANAYRVLRKLGLA